MKYGLNRTGIYKFSGFIAVRKLYYERYKKSLLLLFILQSVSHLLPLWL